MGCSDIGGVPMQPLESTAQLTRFQHICRGIRQLMLAETDITVLSQYACDKLVEVGHYQMVCICLMDTSLGDVSSVVHAGEVPDSLDISFRGNTPERTLMEMVVQTKQPQVIPDIQGGGSNPSGEDAAHPRGYRSCAVVPLRCGDTVCGTLNVYTCERDAFDDETLTLLEEAAENTAFALKVIQDREERTLLEKERQDLQKQLYLAQRLESVGQLAGGIAHDFNNLLTAMLGYGQLAIMKMEQQQYPQDEVEEMIKASRRATKLTRQLLAFSRQQALQLEVVNINTLIHDIENMLRRLIDENIELTTNLAEELGWTEIDPGQLEQILINLVVNARDAMPEGGHLTIKTTNAAFLNEAYVRSNVVMPPGDYVVLTVSDTGDGMPSELIAHIFDPFFTTKERVTGLGLATVYGIVKQSGGYIWVDSEPGQGSRFQIYLPQVKSNTALAEPEDTVNQILRGTKTILVVEDEEIVRQSMVHSLRSRGYTVLEATHGESALRAAEQYSGKIHLMITDVVMPNMSGYDLTIALRALRPEMKVLYISGHAEKVVHHRIRDDAFLSKPFSPSTLAGIVQQVLNLHTSVRAASAS